MKEKSVKRKLFLIKEEIINIFYNTKRKNTAEQTKLQR